MPERELYGAASCRFTAELRDDLEWRGEAFAYYDVEQDPEALARMLRLTGGQRMVPVLVVDGVVAEVGYQGRGCMIGPQPGDATG